MLGEGCGCLGGRCACAPGVALAALRARNVSDVTRDGGMWSALLDQGVFHHVHVIVTGSAL